MEDSFVMVSEQEAKPTGTSPPQDSSQSGLDSTPAEPAAPKPEEPVNSSVTGGAKTADEAQNTVEQKAELADARLERPVDEEPPPCSDLRQRPHHKRTAPASVEQAPVRAHAEEKDEQADVGQGLKALIVPAFALYVAYQLYRVLSAS